MKGESRVVTLVVTRCVTEKRRRREGQGDLQMRAAFLIAALSALAFDTTQAQTSNSEHKAVAALNRIGAKVTSSEEGQVAKVSFLDVDVTDEDLRHLRPFTHLSSLNLFGAKITGTGLKHVSGHKNLEIILLGHSQITDEGLRHLSGLHNLTFLSLGSTRVSDGGLYHLKDLKKLESLKIGNTRVTDAGLAHLKGLTSLKLLILGKSPVTDRGLEHLKGLANLEVLGLHSPQISDAGLKHLRVLTRLKHLSLSGTKVSPDGIEHVKSMNRIEMLELSGEQLTDVSAKYLTALPNLKALYLLGITGTNVRCLKELKNVQSLFVWRATLTDEDMAQLSGLTNLKMLSLNKSSTVTDAGLAYLPKSTSVNWNSPIDINNFRQIGLAFHNYHSTYGRFPPHTKERAKLSWRVHLLPFLDQAPLYDRFKLDEPWDSPHNKQLLKNMPKLYGPKGTTTRILGFAGKGAPFGKPLGLGSRDIPDGTSNTILVVEAGPDKAVPWTKPADLTFDPSKPLAALGKIPDEGVKALFADFSIGLLPKDIDAATLKALVTYNGGERIAKSKQLPRSPFVRTGN